MEPPRFSQVASAVLVDGRQYPNAKVPRISGTDTMGRRMKESMEL